MAQLKWKTPNKHTSARENLIINSPVIYKTPVKQCERNSKHTTYQNNKGGFNVLPSHITPPSGLTRFIARNPFETDLTSRLHLSVLSPTVFSQVSNRSLQSPDFKWSVEELALIQPAKIEEFPEQQIHHTDPETEIKAQAAIDKFFNENEIIPSPWELKSNENRTKLIDSFVGTSNDSNSESSKSKKDGWSQTVLSFPPKLPSHVMEILKPYFTFTQEQNAESDDANSSNNSSLRRKLFFNNEDNEEDSVCLSPIQIDESLLLTSISQQNGMLANGIPLRNKHSPNGEYHCNTLSSPDISPIHSTINTSCDSTKSRSRLVARLDYNMDVNLNHSNVQSNKELPNNHTLDDESLNNIDVKITGKERDNCLNLENASTCIEVDTHAQKQILIKNSTLIGQDFETGISELNFNCRDAASTFKYPDDSCRTNESCMLQQTNGMLGISDQQSVSNFAQDTGYHTYSMSNVTDSYTTPVKQELYWRDRIFTSEDALGISDWKENLKNVFSSTPSRSNKEKDNHVS